jgi:hypothetical protein
MTLHAHQGGPREQQQQRIIYLFGKHSVQFPVSLGSRSSPAGGRAVKSPSAAPPQPAAQRRRAGCPTRQTSGGGGVRSHQYFLDAARLEKDWAAKRLARKKLAAGHAARERDQVVNSVLLLLLATADYKIKRDTHREKSAGTMPAWLESQMEERRAPHLWHYTLDLLAASAKSGRGSDFFGAATRHTPQWLFAC